MAIKIKFVPSSGMATIWDDSTSDDPEPLNKNTSFLASIEGMTFTMDAPSEDYPAFVLTEVE